ncbi:transcriptional regulator, GntR family [Rhizobiales bacterium GAS191]|jgi:DNA-binding GntR family transcriptional regulator|nr:transcriptional regulator, GntR family [Rhizobiales bacterium GAS113]SED98967.1 transcriptional regulator, GntR family [Rhizobiales bacterium GAS188]SEE54157.1 transcriptional regulator, GntR family [Rhizobiales bacterium GAS191]
MRDLKLPDLSASPEPIARRISKALRRAIVTMRVMPGEMLSEQEIAQHFSVSRQPVREAFIKLSEAGLVRVLPQRGTLVVKISAAAVEDARFVREAIECALARRAAAAIVADAALFAPLEAHVAAQERAAAVRDAELFFQLDEDFHRSLAALAGRPSAWRIVEDVKAQMDRVRFLDMSEMQPMAVVIRQHRAILEALGKGDADAAEEAMRVHLSQIEKTLPVLARRYPDLFEPPNRVADGAVPLQAAVDAVAAGARRVQRRNDKPIALAPARRTPG